jgi:hypothetical protein
MTLISSRLVHLVSILGSIMINWAHWIVIKGLCGDIDVVYIYAPNEFI